MATQHTPGPWKAEPRSADDGSRHILGADNSTVGFTTFRTGDTVTGGNAALIAAAPDLLAALEFARARLIACQDCSEPLIDAAIAKARGR